MIDYINWVVTHKASGIALTEGYRKLCVGGHMDDISASEQEGKNIAEYNDRLNELTGLYWIWKNTKDRVVGLNHYRRYFNNCGHRLDQTGVKDILNEHDIIMAPIRLGWSILRNIEMASGETLSRSVFQRLREAIAEKQPNYVEAFDTVMDGDFMYY